jgi:uncharacterized membrane protein HdeD (DUF308 family)
MPPGYWLHPREAAEQATARWWVFILSGVAWLFVSLIVFRFDYASVVAVGTLFGFIAIFAGMFEVAIAASSMNGWRILRFILGVLYIAIGVISFFTPQNTFEALAALVSFFFVFAGSFAIVNAIATRTMFPAWWLGLVSGALEVGLGFWAAGDWDRSTTLLVAWVGATTLFQGVSLLIFGFKLHQMHEDVRGGMPKPA